MVSSVSNWTMHTGEHVPGGIWELGIKGVQIVLKNL